MQPNYSGTCNTAKSCTKYSQNICSVSLSYPQTQLSQKLRLQSPPQTPNSLFLLWCCVSICVLFLSSSSAERHGKDGTRPIGQIRHILSWYQIHSKYLQPVYSHWLCYMCHCNLAVIITVNDSTHKIH